MDNKDNNSTPITPETKDAFFVDLVTRIRDTKVQIKTSETGIKTLNLFQPNDPNTPDNVHSVLNTFDEPLGRNKGVRREKLISEKAQHHHTDWSKDSAGTVWHIGDVPYIANSNTHLTRWKDQPIDQSDISENMRSGKLAISCYMPDDAFKTYLSYFREHIDAPEHKQALNKSFRELQEQCPSAEDSPLLPNSKTKPFLKTRGIEPNASFLEILNKTEDKRFMTDHPDIALAMVIYHAAHGAYVAELNTAFMKEQRKGSITAEQYDNANYTLNTDIFNEFKQFASFMALEPLIMMHYNESSHIEDESTRKQQAISTAWADLLNSSVFTRTFDAEALPPTEKRPQGGGIVTCPAREHLKSTADMGLLEETYSYVDEHLRDSNFMERTQKILDAAHGKIPASTSPSR